jgi:hypothetical protein
MALKMDGRDLNLKRAFFVAFGSRRSVRPAAVNAILDEVCDGIEPWLKRLDEIGLDRRKTAHLRRAIEQRRGVLR